MPVWILLCIKYEKWGNILMGYESNENNRESYADLTVKQTQITANYFRYPHTTISKQMYPSLASFPASVNFIAAL